MKMINKIMMAFVAVALLGLSTSCNKDDSNSGSGSTGGNANGYSSMIIGTWAVNEVLNDGGQNIYPSALNMKIAFYSGGSGLMTYSSYGTGPFSWVISGNTCKVYIQGFDSPYDYTIVSMDATNMVLTSNVLDIPGFNHIQGNFRWTLTKEQ